MSKQKPEEPTRSTGFTADWTTVPSEVTNSFPALDAATEDYLKKGVVDAKDTKNTKDTEDTDGEPGLPSAQDPGSLPPDDSDVESGMNLDGFKFEDSKPGDSELGDSFWKGFLGEDKK